MSQFFKINSTNYYLLFTAIDFLITAPSKTRLRTLRLTRITLRLTRITLRLTRITLRLTRITLRLTRITLRLTRLTGITLRLTRLTGITLRLVRLTRITLVVSGNIVINSIDLVSWLISRTTRYKTRLTRSTRHLFLIYGKN